jgi:hypothetical protein
MKTPNKFTAIFRARSQATGTEPAVTAPAQSKAIAPQAAATAPAKHTGRRAGRGKKSDPHFKQVTAYIPANLHENATIALRFANQTRLNADKEDFSELLTHLLADWYQRQNYYRPGL